MELSKMGLQGKEIRGTCDIFCTDSVTELLRDLKKRNNLSTHHPRSQIPFDSVKEKNLRVFLTSTLWSKVLLVTLMFSFGNNGPIKQGCVLLVLLGSWT